MKLTINIFNISFAINFFLYLNFQLLSSFFLYISFTLNIFLYINFIFYLIFFTYKSFISIINNLIL